MASKRTEVFFLFTAMLSIVGLFVVAAIHGIGWYPLGVEKDIFEHEMGDNWRKYDLDIIMVDWMFYIWMVIYGFQLMWLLYCFFAVRKINKYGSLVTEPPIISSTTNVAFILGLAGTIGWVVLFDQYRYVAYSIICIAAATIFLTLAASFSVHSMRMHEHDVVMQKLYCDVIIIRFILQNHLAAFLTWTSAIGLYTMCIILHHISELLEKETSQYVALGVLAGYMVIWLIIDVFRSQKLTGHLFAPYLVVALAYIMPVYKNYENKGGTNFDYDSQSKLFYISVGLLLATICAILLKLVVLIVWACKSRKRPAEVQEEFGAVGYEGYHEGTHTTNVSQRSSMADQNEAKILDDDNVFDDDDYDDDDDDDDDDFGDSQAFSNSDRQLGVITEIEEEPNI